MTEQSPPFLDKALQSLRGAASELAAGRYDNCANRTYYATFQAAVAALQRAGVRPRGARGQWGHAFVPAQFDGELINHRKLYPPDLRTVLLRNYDLRQIADYHEDGVTETQAERALRRSRAFVLTVAGRER